MTALIVLAFITVGLSFAYLFRGQHVDAVKTARLLDLIEGHRKEAEDERRELLNRIQHPERMPTKVRHPGTVRSNVSTETRQAFAHVGHVAPQRLDDGNG